MPRCDTGQTVRRRTCAVAWYPPRLGVLKVSRGSPLATPLSPLPESADVWSYLGSRASARKASADRAGLCAVVLRSMLDQEDKAGHQAARTQVCRECQFGSERKSARRLRPRRHILCGPTAVRRRWPQKWVGGGSDCSRCLVKAEDAKMAPLKRSHSGRC
ncbi:hypothetical protein LX32DRAFT_645903 [Colletotrichum zoysiae]|uniref:Uncharacterized protein n=1 Tax=Colletotrichum zoysiae TaxID=1216348 RepID=A0AAD9H534_9PEZI|nr:hypothetical protein LX32DRAFT_645903 [Colletotrichum zoysiae]